MKKQRSRSKQGVSLIELIIYLGLLSVLLVVLTQVFTSIIQIRLESESTSSVEQDANFIMSRFMYDIGRAQSITSPTLLAVPSSTLQLSINGIAYTYTLMNGNLQITNNLGTDVLNSLNTTISNLQFTRIGNGISATNSDTIKVNFTVTSVAQKASGKTTTNYEIAVAPR